MSLENKKTGKFLLNKNISAKANTAVNKSELIRFWHNFSFGVSRLEIEETDEFVFSVGNAAKPELADYAYAVNIEEDGIFVAASNEKNLIYGFMTLLNMIQMDEPECAYLKCCELRESPKIKIRMAHFCVFHDTELWELEKFVKLCAALKYSHVIVEFWGMLKLDFMKELAWERGFDKNQISPIIKTANELGLEIVPMFNHWGHASAGQLMHGKHVVLDQNPSLQYLFSDDGWRWRIERNDVRVLLRQIRAELEELCGAGEYFHIGCDEAFGFGYSKHETDELAEFINEVSDELKQSGRKAIMWADMLLSQRNDDEYVCNAPDIESEKYMMSKLNKEILMADWQYTVKKLPVETSIALKKAGFDVLICPWDISDDACDACVGTAKEYELGGVLHTTWHTLTSGYQYVSRVAAECWSDEKKPWFDYILKNAALMRKINPNSNYEKSGWAKRETGIKL